MMSSSVFGRIGMALAGAAALALCGCGNTFRPIANPIVQSGGDTGNLRNAIVLSSAGTTAGALGATTQIDVSGDTETSQHTVGVNPAAAAIVSGNVITLNRGDNTLSGYLLFGGPGSSTTTINLNGTGSNFTCPTAIVHDSAHIFVTMSGQANSDCPVAGQSGLAVVSASSLLETATVPSNGTSFGLGSDPEAMVELANNNQVFIANKGSNTVSVMNSVDNSFTVPNVAVGSSPDAIVASPDNACVYVANGTSNTVSVINVANALAGKAAAAVDETLPVGAGPSAMIFDRNLQRVYVVNSGGDSVTVIQHQVTNPGSPPAPVCSSSVIHTVSTGVDPVGVFALADGSRFYVANNSSSASATVSVFDANSFALRTTITGLQPNPRSIAAAGDSTRVYVASATQQSVPLAAGVQSSIAIINTAGDTLLPVQSTTPEFSCPTSSNPKAMCYQSPDFVFLTQ